MYNFLPGSDLFSFQFAAGMTGKHAGQLNTD
jgi:hypothetical protein